MSDAATEFLTTWSLQQEHGAPFSHEDAERVAEQWEQDAADNDIDPAELRAAAGGDLAAYLLRTFGARGDELDL